MVFVPCARSSAWIERQIADLEVVGSNPAGRTISFTINGAVAQLARASAWHAEGQGFKSPQLHQQKDYKNAPLAQGVLFFQYESFLTAHAERPSSWAACDFAGTNHFCFAGGVHGS